MGYRFSQRSKDRMFGVHSDLTRVAERALQLTKIDFGGQDGHFRTFTAQNGNFLKRDMERAR